MPVSPTAPFPAAQAPAPGALAPRILALDVPTRIAAGLSALALGLFLVWGVGFAGAQSLHDTAHDVRHGFGFPCH